jgi:hypothetical protein
LSDTQEVYFNYLKPLIGGKIKKIVVDPDKYGDTYMGLIVENGKRTYEVIANTDPEGNGAGFLQVTKISDFTTKKVDSKAVAE